MQAPKRISLNTSMKDAKIFEEHSDDEKEPLTIAKLIKQEKGVTIKSEPLDPPAKEVTFDLSRVKHEIKHEEDAGICISSAVAEMQLITPIKNEEQVEQRSKANLKSAKRSLLKQRNSPYAKEMSSGYVTRSTVAAKEDTLYEQLKKTTRNLNGYGNRDRERPESDPEVLKRRQKQIDFGKNTIGYDNYVKQVPIEERTAEDPGTPNKYRTYSRRGFDGLIKQWRLKLHKYDP